MEVLVMFIKQKKHVSRELFYTWNCILVSETMKEAVILQLEKANIVL